MEVICTNLANYGAPACTFFNLSGRLGTPVRPQVLRWLPRLSEEFTFGAQEELWPVEPWSQGKTDQWNYLNGDRYGGFKSHGGVPQIIQVMSMA